MIYRALPGHCSRSLDVVLQLVCLSGLGHCAYDWLYDGKMGDLSLPSGACGNWRHLPEGTVPPVMPRWGTQAGRG